MSEGTAAAEGASSGASMGGAAVDAASNPSWYDSIAGTVKDYGHTIGEGMKNYSRGAEVSLADAVDAYQDGSYMKAAGYAGEKLQGMAGSGGGNPIPLINLPQGQQDTDPMSRYAQLYAQYRRR